MEVHIFDRIVADDRYIPADLLWEELHDHQRKEFLHHLQHGNLVADGRLISSGDDPPHTERVESFGLIPRDVWIDQNSADWEKSEKLWVVLSDASIDYVDISLVNGRFLKDWLGYGASNPAILVTQDTLNAAGKKMNRKVWAAMAALVAKQGGKIANVEVARILCERTDLWAGDAMDIDHLRRYVSDFMCEFKSQQ